MSSTDHIVIADRLYSPAYAFFSSSAGTNARFVRYVIVSREATTPSELLALIAAPERPSIALKAFVIVAHPGDEALACGALLPRLSDVTILHVTDGAPRDLVDAHRSGFTHWADYARARRLEVERAARIARLAPPALKSLGIPDQAAALRLPQLTRALLGFIAGIDLVLTHAYEGGHPDHDAVAFAVGAAHARMRGKAPIVLDMPFRLKNAAVRAGGSERSVRLRLNEEERARKASMIAVFATQRHPGMDITTRDEVYRIAPAHDFTQPLDTVLYDGQALGMTGGQFAALARAARGELGLDATPQ